VAGPEAAGLMSARTKARKRALDVLYESELRADSSLGSTLAGRIDDAEPPLNPYTVQLVEGVVQHREEIDRLLAEHAVGWTLDRMPAIDRNLLRLAVFEICYLDDVPDPVAVSEAVTLATSLSTEQSPTFVNGLLARIVREKPHLTV
jgi:N utilization substance protein B